LLHLLITGQHPVGVGASPLLGLRDLMVTQQLETIKHAIHKAKARGDTGVGLAIALLLFPRS
jgi:hypothetical protein